MNFIPNYKNSFRILKGGKISLVVSSFLASTTLSFAAPSGGVVTSGSANISQAGKVTNISQSTQKASINWNKFDIASDETVNFKQPNSSSITLNRVVGNEKSIINGALNANGQVWIINSNGVLFGKGASINTSGLLATTKDISDSDFQAGNYKFTGNSKESVINLGTIDVVNGGSVILAANEVRNEGTIKAIRGKIHLAGADEYTVNLNGNSLINLIVNKGVLDSLVKNSGTVLADGGEIYLTTNAVNELLKGVVNNTGIIEANSLDGITGKVELFAHGGEAKMGGTVTALEGFVETSGDKVKIADDFRVKADKWLIDPKDFTIAASGGDITGATLSSNLEDASIEIQSVNGATDGNGDIFVNDTITWSSANKLTLNAYNDIYINKGISASNGKLELHYGQATADGGISDYYINAKVNLSEGENFITKKGSVITTWNVINTDTNLQNMISNSNYALGADINLANISNWEYTSRFSGKLDGLGHIVDKLNITSSSVDSVGLFSETKDATIKNLGLTNANISVDKKYVGGIVGKTDSTTIENTYFSGSITTSANTSYVGGLVGYNSNSKIKKSYTEGTVKVTGFGAMGNGGLVGYNKSASLIEDSYSLATVTGKVGLGGLVGNNYGSTIKNSYASGVVNPQFPDRSGGLVFENTGGTIENSYYDNETNTKSMGNTDYGKTKAEIVTAFSGLEAWTVGGASVEGYSTATALTLPQLVAFYTPSGEILFAGGFGTEADPYEITNWTQLQNINNSNILTQGYYFSLLNNLGSSTAGYTTQVKDGETLANSESGWTALGNENTKFTGTFDGLGHTISNLKINNTSNFTGLFGITDDATIKNIGVVDADIQSRYAAGILIGDAKNTTIKKSYTTGKITGTSNEIGGLVGRFASGGGNSYIENSYSSADVTGTDQVGGLVGLLLAGAMGEDATTSISNAYATGNVSGAYNVGGLVGRLSADSMGATATASISNAYATGNVSGANNLGGLVGELFAFSMMEGDATATASISNAYATGNVSGTGSLGGLVANVYNGTIENSWYDNETNTDTSMADSDTYGKTKAELRSLAAQNWDDTVWTFSDATQEGFGVYERPILKDVTTEADKPDTFTLFEGGFGTSDDAYTITNWTQLQNINNSNILTQGYYFSLLNNLGSTTDGYTTQVKDGETLANGGTGWKPIGSQYSTFTGSFDGLGHTVDALIIDNNTSSYQGLFGGVKTGSNIKNVGVTNVNIKGKKRVGALAGDNKGNISNAYSTGTVVGTGEYAGGLVGHNSGSVENSYSLAAATSPIVGGLVGQNTGTISNSYASSSVAGSDNSDTVGGLTNNYLGGTVTNSWYDNEINTGTMSDSATYGKTTKEMQTLATFKNAGWSIEFDETQKKIYPYLTFDENGGAIWKVGKYATALNYILGTANTTYDGTNQLLTEFWANTIFGDNGSSLIAGTDYKFVYDSEDATVFKNAGTYNNISVVILNEDYELDETGTNTLGKFVIAKKALSITGTTTDDKTYNGNTKANVNLGTLSGFVGDETVSASAVGTFNSKDAGSRTATFEYTLEDGTNGGLANNYSLANTTDEATIQKADATVTANSDTVTYNGTSQNVNGFTASGLVGNETESVLTGITGATASGKNAGEYVTTLSGTDGNYNLTFVDGKLTISKANATVTANSNTVTYNGQTQNVNGFTASGLVGNETESVLTGITGATASGKNAGEYVTTLSGTDGNYNLTFVDGKLTISKANATVTANSNTVTYNGQTQNVNGFTASGLVNNETSSVLDSVTGASANGTNAGTYKTSLSGSDNNYNLTFVDGQLVINKANATVTANSDTVTYNGLAQNSGFSASGLVNGETISVLDGVSVSTGTNAGTYVLKASGTDGNYNLTFVDGKLTISKANATVTANSDTVTYNGQIQNVNGFTASGLVGNETESVLTGITGATASGKNAGEYTLSASGEDENYNLTFVDGKLVIEKANATVIANSDSVTYNGQTQNVNGFTASGLVGNETESVLTGITGATASGKNAGEYVTTLSGTDGNYNLTFVDGKLTISKANATVTANSNTVTYNGLAQNSGFSASGLVNGETISVLDGVSVSTGTNAGTYVLKASGTDENYNLTFVDGTLKIEKADATVTANSDTTTYTGLTQTVNGFTATGLVNGETTSVLDNVTATASGINAGTYTATASGTDENYNLTFVDGTLKIEKADATVTANSDTTTYTGLTQTVNGFTATGLVNGETTSVLDNVTATASGINAGTYTATASGTDENYNLTFVDGTLKIEKADATVTANSDTTTYTGLTQTVNGFTATGLVNGETTSVLDNVTATASGINAGTYTATASGTDENYNLTFEDGSLVVNPKSISVSANDLEKIIGSSDPMLTYIAQGLIGEDLLEGLLSRNSGEAVGSYTISKGTLANPNYSITFNEGIFTIKRNNQVDDIITTIVNKKSVTVTPPTPQTTTTTPNNIGKNVNIIFVQGENQMLVSKPIEGQATTRVSLSEARQMQIQNGGSGEEVIVPLSNSSIIQLIDGGVNLPSGVEQEFYLANANTQEEK